MMHSPNRCRHCYPQLRGVYWLQVFVTFLPFRPLWKPALTFRPLPPDLYLNRLKSHPSRLRTLEKRKRPTSTHNPLCAHSNPLAANSVTRSVVGIPLQSYAMWWRPWVVVFVGLQVLCEYAFTGGWFDRFVCHPSRQLSTAEY